MKRNKDKDIIIKLLCELKSHFENTICNNKSEDVNINKYICEFSNVLKNTIDNMLDYINNDVNHINKINEDILIKDTVNKDTVNKDTLNKDNVNKDTLNTDTLNKDTLNDYNLNDYNLNINYAQLSKLN